MARATNSISDKRPYKVYTALLTQEGINAPTAEMLENSLGEVTYEFDNTGVFKVISDGLFVQNKTYISLTNGNNTNFEGFYSIHYIDENLLYIMTSILFLGTLTATNGMLINTSIEIRVYN